MTRTNNPAAWEDFLVRHAVGDPLSRGGTPRPASRLYARLASWPQPSGRVPTRGHPADAVEFVVADRRE